MKNKGLRVVGSLAGISVLLFSVAGCGWTNGGGNNAASPSTVPTATATATPTPTPEPTATPTPEPSPTPASDEVDDIVSAMTLEEKIGQLLLVGIDGTKLDASARSLIAESHVGGIILYKNNFSTVAGSVKLVNELKAANSDNPVPLFISVDQEGGKVSRLPSDFAAIPDNAKVGRTNDPELAEQMGSLIGRELKMMGFNVDFAPVLDVNSNPNNPVIGVRSFGSDAELVSKMGVAEMNGLRGEGVVSVVKHFPGHGDTGVDSHLDLPVVNKTLKQLKSMEWLPFEAAIKDDADAVMVAHILFPRIDPDAPASFSDIIIGEQLRGELGYDGVVITDDMTMGAVAEHYGIAEAAVRSIAAGADIALVAHGYKTEKKVYDELLSAVKEGKIEESRIDESVRRVVALKRKYAMTDSPTIAPKTSELPNADIESWLKKVEAKSK